MFGSASMRALSLRAIASVTSFSRVPRRPTRARILAAVARDRSRPTIAGAAAASPRRRRADARRRRGGQPGSVATGAASAATASRQRRRARPGVGRASASSGSSGLSGIEVEHQPVPVLARPAAAGRPAASPRLAGRTRRARRRAGSPDAHRLDVGIARRSTFVGERLRAAASRSTPSRSSTSRSGFSQREQLVLDRAGALERDARVFLRRPHARGRRRSPRRDAGGERQTASQERAATAKRAPTLSAKRASVCRRSLRGRSDIARPPRSCAR